MLVWGGAAGAQTPSEADALFAEGRDLLEKGRFAEACAKLQRSEDLAPAVGTLLNLGFCWEQLGRFRSAMEAYAEAEVLAHDRGDDKRSAFAKERFDAVVPKALKLVIRVADPKLAGLEVRRNDALVPPTDYGQPIPVDPDDFVVTATAPGHQPWRTVVHTRGDGAVTTIVVPPLSAGPAERSDGIATVLGPRRLAAVALAAGSLGAFGAGTALALSAKGRHDDSLHHCDPSGCDATGVEIQRSAVAQGNVATVAFVVGALFVGAGTWLWITGAPEPPRAGARRVRLAFSPSGLGGSF